MNFACTDSGGGVVRTCISDRAATFVADEVGEQIVRFYSDDHDGNSISRQVAIQVVASSP